MKDEAKALLFDMQRSCERIIAFAEGKDFSAYQSDVYFRSAVERQFQIVGEALARLSKFFPEIADNVPSRRTIIGFRNILVHGYDKVDDEVVWNIIARDLPGLGKAVNDLLGKP